MINTKNILKTLISHDSTLNNESSIAEFLEGYFQGLDIQIKRIKLSNNRFNIYAYRAPEKTNVLWYGHMDTVPVYEGWDTDPFTLVEKDDRYYGLGACDMKGGIAALLVAVADMDRTVPLRILFCADEEYDSEGAWEVYKNYPQILNGVTNIISMEPGASKNKSGGSDVLTLGRRGRVRIAVSVTGVSSHGGHPERGANAVDIALDLGSLYRQMSLTTHPELGPATHYIAAIAGNSVGLSLPEKCEFEIDRHLVIPDDVTGTLSLYQSIAEKYLKELKKKLPPKIAPKVNIQVSLKPRQNDYMLPYITDKNDPFVRTVQNVMLKHNSAVTLNYGKSVGDENVFAQMPSVKPLIIGPEGGNIHAANEWVSIQSLNTCAAMYQEILKLSSIKTEA